MLRILTRLLPDSFNYSWRCLQLSELLETSKNMALNTMDGGTPLNTVEGLANGS